MPDFAIVLLGLFNLIHYTQRAELFSEMVVPSDEFCLVYFLLSNSLTDAFVYFFMTAMALQRNAMIAKVHRGFSSHKSL